MSFAQALARANLAVIEQLGGQAITLTPPASEPVALTGVFLGAYSESSIGMAGLAARNASLAVLSADVPADVVGSVVAGLAIAYVVKEHKPDGLGISMLELEQSA